MISIHSLSVKWQSEAQLVLKGHRSIANQVRFNPENHLIISSGVEKVIKVSFPVQCVCDMYLCVCDQSLKMCIELF